MPENDKLKQEIDKAKKELQEEFENFKEKHKKKIDDYESKESIKNECNETIKELNKEIANKKHSLGTWIKGIIEGNKALLYKFLDYLKKEQNKILSSIAIIMVVVTAVWFFSIPKVMDVNRYKENKDVAKLCALISETLEYKNDKYLDVSYKAVDAIIFLKDKDGYAFLEKCVENNYNENLRKYIINKFVENDKFYIDKKIIECKNKLQIEGREYYIGNKYDYYTKTFDNIRLYGFDYNSLDKIDIFIYSQIPSVLSNFGFRDKDRYLMAEYFIKCTEDNNSVSPWKSTIKKFVEYSKLYINDYKKGDEIQLRLLEINSERRKIMNKDRISLSGYIISLYGENEYFIRTNTGYHAILSTSMTKFTTTGFFSMYVTDGGWKKGHQYYYEDVEAKLDGDKIMDLYHEEVKLEKERKQIYKRIDDNMNLAESEYLKIEKNVEFLNKYFKLDIK